MNYSFFYRKNRFDGRTLFSPPEKVGKKGGANSIFNAIIPCICSEINAKLNWTFQGPLPMGKPKTRGENQTVTETVNGN
jgi:hypothetical protein